MKVSRVSLCQKTNQKRPTRIGSGTNPSMGPVDAVWCCCCKQAVSRYLPVLPFMAAYVCIDCHRKGLQRAVPVSEITNKYSAPWTPEQVASLKEYQRSNRFLPFVCPSRHILVPQPDGLICPNCPGFSLKWVYPWVLDSSWKREL